MRKIVAACVMTVGMMGCLTNHIPMYGQRFSDGPFVQIGSNSNTEWRCEQTDINQTEVWLTCRFHNFASNSGEVNTCLKLSYVSKMDLDEVAGSRIVCSDLLNEDTEVSHFFAFQKQDRKDLTTYCGRDNNRCYLKATEVKR